MAPTNEPRKPDLSIEALEKRIYELERRVYGYDSGSGEPNTPKSK